LKCTLFDGGPSTQQYSKWLEEGLKARGIDIFVVEKLDVLMREAGFTNVTKQTYILPIGNWGGRVGQLLAEDVRLGTESLEPLYTDILGIPREEVESTIASALEEFKSFRTYIQLYVHLGQKQ
jgi:hypothetical protein